MFAGFVLSFVGLLVSFGWLDSVRFGQVRFGSVRARFGVRGVRGALCLSLEETPDRRVLTFPFVYADPGACGGGEH